MPLRNKKRSTSIQTKICNVLSVVFGLPNTPDDTLKLCKAPSLLGKRNKIKKIRAIPQIVQIRFNIFCINHLGF
jgi:hypothetical protein